MPMDVFAEKSEMGNIPHAEGTANSGFLLALLFFACFLPISLEIADQKIDPVRLYLLILFVPFAVKMISGRAGRLTSTDSLMVAFSFWMIVTLVFNHGMQIFPYSIVSVIEGLGGYMAGRLFIRNPSEYRKFIRYYLVALSIVLPLAVFEFFTDRMPLRELFDNIFAVLSDNHGERYGFKRVQVAFPHAILYGLFCSIPIASICYLYGNRISRLLPRLGLAAFMTLMSLSSGPLISMLLQVSLVIWGKMTGDRWKLLLILFLFVFFALEILSNRGPVIIFIETMSLDPWTGWTRVYQWQYGSAAVLLHPFMGIGLGSFDRPSWLTHSIDNFWLLMALRHGLIGVAFLASAWGVHIFRIVRLRNISADAQLVRKAHIVTLVGLVFTLFTVHVWSAMYVMTMFLLGSGAFLYTSALDSQNLPQEVVSQNKKGSRVSRPLTRFPGGISFVRTSGPVLDRANVVDRPSPSKVIQG